MKFYRKFILQILSKFKESSFSYLFEEISLSYIIEIYFKESKLYDKRMKISYYQ